MSARFLNNKYNKTDQKTFEQAVYYYISESMNKVNVAASFSLWIVNLKWRLWLLTIDPIMVSLA